MAVDSRERRLVDQNSASWNRLRTGSGNSTSFARDKINEAEDWEFGQMATDITAA